MRKLVYYIGVSLDGYIAGPGGEVDFYPGLADPDYQARMNGLLPETVPTAYRTLAGLDGVPSGRFDTVLMGQGTYRAGGVASPYAHLRQYVVSSTLDRTGDPAVTLVRQDPIGLVRSLKAEPGMDLWLCGGGKLAAALLPELDELVVKSYPVVAGAGIPVFDGAFQPTAFTPANRETFPTGVQVTTFTRA
ncbi:MAG: dihydrofolate reductase [Nonomuraea sp.]|nr:dihydrofolate reductase [Nonomuraea sp.]